MKCSRCDKEISLSENVYCGDDNQGICKQCYDENIRKPPKRLEVEK